MTYLTKEGKNNISNVESNKKHRKQNFIKKYHYMTQETLNAKQIVEYFNLPYGKTTFYKKLREWGLLDKNNVPSYEMLVGGYIIVRTPLIYNGFRNTNVNVPVFTWKFIRFIESYFEKSDAT